MEDIGATLPFLLSMSPTRSLSRLYARVEPVIDPEAIMCALVVAGCGAIDFPDDM